MNKLLVVLLALSIAGCSKKAKPEDSKMAKLCVQATDQLKRDSSTADPETFQMMISNGLQSCAGGCDDGNQDSCKALDGHVAKLCGVSASVCEQLCGSVKSPALKKATCEFKKK
jgi:hypothetical protein